MMKTGEMDSPTALTSILGAVTAVVIPGYESSSRICRGQLLEEGDVLADCRHAATVLRRGDTNLSVLIGITIAKRI
jgi:hypothetical protein